MRDPAYDLVINDKGFMLARADQLPDGALAWQVQLQGTSAGDADEESVRFGRVSPVIEMPKAWSDLSGGYGSWNDGAKRKYHWGHGVDCRFPNMVIPGPLVTIIPITDGTAPVSDIKEHNGKLWVVSGQFIKAVTPPTYALTDALDSGANHITVAIEEFNGTLYASQSGIVQDFTHKQKHHHTGEADNTWSDASGAVYRGLMCMLKQELYATSSASSTKHVAGDPEDDANWAGPDPIGETSSPITSLAALEETLYAGKEDGVYGLDSSGLAPALAPELRSYKCSINCKNMRIWHGGLVVPHLRGLLQYISRGDGTHMITPISPGRGATEDNPILGHVTAIAGDEKYLYAALWTGQFDSVTGGTTYILAGTPDTNAGTWAWHPLIKLADNHRCDAMTITGLWTNPHLFFGYGADVAYIKLPRGGDIPKMDTSCTYALTGTLRYQRTDFGSPSTTKVWKSIEIEADNLNMERSIEVWTRIDKGDWTSWGNVYESPRSKIYFNAGGISGRSIELRLDFTMPNSTNPWVLRSVVLRGAERPVLSELITAQVRCADKIRLNNGGVNSVTGAEIWESLRDLVQHDDAVILKDLLGITRHVLCIPPLEQTLSKSEGGMRPEALATLRMLTWETTDYDYGEHIFLAAGQGGGAGWVIPWTIPWTTNASTVNIIDVTETNLGESNSKPVITIVGRLNSFVLTNITTGQVISGFSVGANDSYTIDCSDKVCKDRTGAVVAGVTVPDFWLLPGVNHFSLTGTMLDANSAVSMRYFIDRLVL